jgi:hypothetical protein
LVVVA